MSSRGTSSPRTTSPVAEEKPVQAVREKIVLLVPFLDAGLDRVRQLKRHWLRRSSAEKPRALARGASLARQPRRQDIDESLLMASFPCPRMPTRESDITRGFEWKHFVEAAAVEGLAPLIYFNNRSLMSAGGIPSECASQLEKAFFSSLARATLFLQEFRDIAGMLAGIDFAPLKGVYLASMTYSSPALRPFSDIDILVRKTDFEMAAKRLVEAGFRQEGPVDSSSGTPPFSLYLNSATFNKSRRGPSVHVHWHLLNATTPFNLFASVDIEEILQAAHRTPEGWLELCPEHLLIHLAEHALVHSFDRLILLRDIAEVIEKHDALVNWSRFVRSCKAFNLSYPVYCSLLTVSRKTGVTVPDRVLTELRPVRTGACGRIFMKLTSRGIRYPELSALAFFDSAVSFRNRFRFLWRMLFPPRDVLACAYGMKPHDIGMATYASRLLRGFGRAACALRSLVAEYQR